MSEGHTHVAPSSDLRVVGVLDLVMVIHLNGAVDLPSKSAVVDRLIEEIKKQFSSVRSTRRALILDDLVLDQDGHTATRGCQPLNLTPMEHALLEYLLLHQDRVVREGDLMESVFKTNGVPRSLNTLWVHMHRLRRKVDEGHARKLIYTVRGFGYVLRTPAAAGPL